MGLKRLHLFEFTDQPWLPQIVRKLFVEHLGFTIRSVRPHDGALSALVKALRMTGARRIVDLCSGSGTPALILQPALEAELGPIGMVLTDKHPSCEYPDPEPTARGAVWYLKESVDATALPVGLSGLRTLFEAFHHFRPAEAKQILQSAVDAGDPIAILEVTERSPTSLLLMQVMPLIAFFVTPFVRPFRWARLLFTYILPVLVLMGWWDGTVSSLRSYSRAELEALIAQLRGRPYTWTFGEHQRGGAFGGWLIGYPSEPTQHPHVDGPSDRSASEPSMPAASAAPGLVGSGYTRE